MLQFGLNVNGLLAGKPARSPRIALIERISRIRQLLVSWRWSLELRTTKTLQYRRDPCF
jgi:hypothetical protein